MKFLKILSILLLLSVIKTEAYRMVQNYDSGAPDTHGFMGISDEALAAMEYEDK